MIDIKQELEKIGTAYADSFNRQDAAGIAALYANGGMHINPAGPRTDIEQLHQAIFKAGFDHQETSLDEAWPLGTDTALAMGQYRIAGKDPAGAPIERGGYWTATYVREGGKWKIRMQTALPSETQKYYRMSQKKLELGKPLQGTGALHLGAELEKLLGQQRPDECISRTDCVFFSDNEDPKKHGLPYDYGYLHVIEPVGPVQKRDNYWLGQLQTRHHPTLSSRQDPSIAGLTDKELADKYWKGEPSNKPNWEMVARSATVIEYASEEPVQVRKPSMADALKAVAEYENSKKAEK